jgi:hypothetical protein
MFYLSAMQRIGIASLLLAVLWLLTLWATGMMQA